jgi:hypothetical protein
MRLCSLTRHLNRKLAFALVISIVLSGLGFVPFVHAQDQEQINLDQFDRLTASTGWILMDQHIFWTSDAGQTWKDIRPAVPVNALLQDVEFIDSKSGWMLWTTPNPDGSADFHLASTIDTGGTWIVCALPLFEAGDIASHAEKAEMGWIDSQTGWIPILAWGHYLQP